MVCCMSKGLNLSMSLFKGPPLSLIIPNWGDCTLHGPEGAGWTARVQAVTSKHARNGTSLKNSVPITAFLKG